jgi:hypothetical protein
MKTYKLIDGAWFPSKYRNSLTETSVIKIQFIERYFHERRKASELEMEVHGGKYRHYYAKNRKPIPDLTIQKRKINRFHEERFVWKPVGKRRRGKYGKFIDKLYIRIKVIMMEYNEID